MRPKSRMLLASGQALIAFGLIVLYSSAPKGDTLGGSGRDEIQLQLCWALDSPAAVLAHFQREMTREFVMAYPRIGIVFNDIVVVCLVWLLWYAVGTETRGKGLSVLTPKTGIRRTADIVAILFGASLVPYADSIVGGGGYYTILLSCTHILWTVAIILFYGHDLWASFRCKPVSGPQPL